MLKTNSKEYRAKAHAYLHLAAYDFEGTEANAAQHIRDRFESEYNYPANRQRHPNLQKRIREWHAGLALNVAFYYHEIRAVAEEWHGCTLTDAQVDRFMEQWFDHLAMMTLTLWKKHGTPYPTH